MCGLKHEINWYILCIFYLTITASASISVMAPFFPTEAAKKGVSASLSGAVFSVYGIVLVFGNVVTGKIIPIIGSKITLSLGILLLGVANIAFGLLEYIESLTAFLALCFFVRSLEAIGASLVNTTSYSIIINNSQEKSTKPISINEVCNSFGYSIGPVIGSCLYTIGGYKLPFLFLGSAVLVNLPVSLFFIPTQKDKSQKDEHSNSLTYLKLLSIPRVVVVLFVLATSGINFGVIASTLTLHLQTFRVAPASVGYFFIIIPLTYGIVGIIVGYASSRSQSLYLFLIGSTLSALAFILMSPPSLLSFIGTTLTISISLFILGVGNGLALIPTLPTILGIVIDIGFDDDVITHSLVSGLWTTVYSIEATVGPFFGGVIYQLFGFESLSFVIAGANIIAAAIVFFEILFSPFFGKKAVKHSSGYEEIEENQS